MKKFLVALLILSAFVSVPPAHTVPTTYYLDNTNPAKSDSNTGTNPALPWEHFSKATSTLVAGDTLIVGTGGSYNVRVTETTDGTLGAPITYIAAAGSPRPKVMGVTLSGADYVTWSGFEMTSSGLTTDNVASVNLVNTHTGDIITNNYIHDITGSGPSTAGMCISTGSGTFDQITYNTINYCGVDAYAGGGHQGIHNNSASPGSSDMLIEGNTISYVSDHVNPYGSRWVIRNNTFGPDDPASAIHIDGVQNDVAAASGLYEGNLHIDRQSSDNHFILNQQASSAGWIVRYNSTLRSKGGLDWRVSGNHSFYNNTFYDNIGAGNANNFQILLNASTALARNNIWYHSSSSTPYAVGLGGGTYDKDYDNRYLSGDPSEAHDINADPQFVDATNGDFRLQAGSTSKDAGGPLTTVAAADTGSGTTLVLTTAYPFQPGWAGVMPDVIAVGTVGNTATISSIDYATGTVTLVGGITRNDGDPVWLKAKSDGVIVLNGAAPDIGSHEYGGLALTSITAATGAEGATVAVTLSGAAFDGGNATVNVSGTGITVNTVVVVNATTITANFVIAASATVSIRTVSVTTNDGTSNTVTFTVTCTSASLAFSSQPTGTGLNLSLGTVAVQVLCGDVSVNTASTASIVLSKAMGATWDALSTSTGTGGLTKSATAGTATWTDLIVTTTPGSGSIAAASSGLTGATSNSVIIAATPSSTGARVKLRVKGGGRR